MPRLENWCLTPLDGNPYQPPEVAAKGLHGIVFDHPLFLDGDEITTSPLVSVSTRGDSTVARTSTGREYVLGQIDPEYERAYPDAVNRLLAKER